MLELNKGKKMYKVVKRDGSIVDFNIHKISKAIEQAFDSVDVNSDADVIDFADN